MIEVRVESVEQAASTIKLFELRAADGGLLPAFEAGAHIDVHVSGRVKRSYSLMNAQAERHRYLIGVNRSELSSGGSRYLHDGIKAGDVLAIDEPRNHFRLVEDAQQVVLIAGGIGITPLWSMIQRLEALARPWQLFYAARSPAHAILLDRLALYGERVSLYHDDGAGARRLDIGEIVGAQPDSTHFYCCGPASMLDAFEQVTASIDLQRVHLERFAARSRQERHDSASCTVVLARSGRSFGVPADRSILDVLLENGVDVGYSCMQGICGSCETAVLEGVPDHRDDYLSRTERAANRKIMVCCSRSMSEKLVLDI